MAKVSRKTYAEFTVPGLLFPESEIVKVKNRDVFQLKVPEIAYGVSFFDILTTSVANKGKKRTKVESNPVNKSKYHNIGTKIYTIKEVEEEIERDKAELAESAIRGRENMLKDMRREKSKFAMKCQVGGFIKLEKGDLVLILNGKNRKVVKIKNK